MILRTGKLQLTYVGEIMASGGWDPKMDHLVCFLPGTLALGAANGAAPAGVALESHPDMVLAKVRSTLLPHPLLPLHLLVHLLPALRFTSSSSAAASVSASSASASSAAALSGYCLLLNDGVVCVRRS